MSKREDRRALLLRLAAEGIIPVLGGCAGALAGGPEGGVVGVAVGHAVEKAINFFGAHIVARWSEWLRGLSPAEQQAALAGLASLSPEEARRQAVEALDELAPDADADDRSLAADYLAAIPNALDRALIGSSGGGRSLPATLSADEPQHLLQLLPADVPPYPCPADLPDTPYRLESLLGSGGFGAVYKANARSLQHLPLAIKFCLDPALLAALQRERDNLERLMQAGGHGWSPRLVRLYGYDLEHETPYLVYEYVEGGDLARHLARSGGGLPPAEALRLVTQIAQALAFAHGQGLVHRDLKPANVLLADGSVKLADFGLGGVAALRLSRLGATTIDPQTLAEQASLFRGAGTPLYMAPEQRRGAPPDPRHDLYSLGVVWFQMLAGDVTRELPAGWARELAVRFAVPRRHIELIERCVGWVEDRPADAGELLRLLSGHGLEAEPPTPTELPEPEGLSDAGRRLRRGLVTNLLSRLETGHAEFNRLQKKRAVVWLSAAFLLPGILFLLLSLAGLNSDEAEALLAAGLVLCLGCLVPGAVRVLRQYAARRAITDSLATLEAEFPDFVRSWGGPLVLRDTATFRALRKLLPAGEGELAPPADACRRTRQVLLASLLGRLAQAHFGARNAAWSPWRWSAGFVTVTVLVALGLLLATGGSSPADVLGTAVVCLVGGWAVGFTIGLSRRAVAVGQVRHWESLLVQEFPDEVRRWGGGVVLRDPAAVSEIRSTVAADSPLVSDAP